MNKKDAISAGMISKPAQTGLPAHFTGVYYRSARRGAGWRGRGWRWGLKISRVLAVACLLELGSAQWSWAADTLGWDVRNRQVNAHLEGWTLRQVLASIAAQTGWEILVEPNTDLRITAAFNDLKPAEALSRLLFNLNYALLPQASGPAKLFVFRTSVQEATLRIPPAPSGKRPASLIPNELILSLKPGAGVAIDELAKTLRAKVIGRLDGRNAYRLQFENEEAADQARAELSSNSDIAGVDSNYTLEPPTRTEPLSLASTQPFNLTAKPGSDPGRPIVGLIDTAVQTQGSRLSDFLLPAIAVAGPADIPAGVPSHGTSMAETILRAVALDPQSVQGTSVRILPVDVYGNQNDTSTFSVAQGIYAAVKAGANIINLSLGGDGDSTFLHDLIREARQQGVVFVAAAGNEPTSQPTYPAAYAEVLATTAGDRRGQIASYANRGAFVDVVAPGAGIVQFNNQSYLVSGTSTATAFMSGTVASLEASSGKPLADVEAQVRKTFSAAAAVKP